jgi:hypothetical protein
MKRFLILLLCMLCPMAYGQTTIAQKLSDISDAKAALKTAIEAKDVVVGAAPFSDYDDKIAAIRTVSAPISIEYDGYLTNNLLAGDIAYIIRDYIRRTIAFDIAPSTVNNVGITGLAMSQDGSHFITKPRGTGSVLTSYKWDAIDQRYEKTAAVSGSLPVQTYQVAMTRDGSKIAMGSTNAAASAGWNETNNRYEIHTTPDTLPLTGYGAAITDDGNRLVITDNNAGATNKVLTYTWDGGDNRYEISASPDAEPTGQAYRCAMSANGDYLAVAHSGAGAPAKLITYKWDVGNNRYGITSAHTATIAGAAVATAMSSSGTKLVVGHTTSPYIVSLTFSQANNRYEANSAVDYGTITPPAGSCYDVDMSDDGYLVAASFLASTTAGIPYFVLYEWDYVNNRYNAIASRRYGTPDYGFSSAATISGDGLFAASAHAENASPAYTYHIEQGGTNLIYQHTNPIGDAATFSTNIRGFGFANTAGSLGQSKTLSALWYRDPYTFNDLTQTITGYDGTSGLDLVIPDQIHSLDVLGIGDYAFVDLKLNTLVLPATVTTIGVRAFSNLSIPMGEDIGITEVTWPTGLLTINDYAFSNNNIATLTIPSTVTTIATGAFAYNDMTTVTIPDSVTDLGKGVFTSCKSLTNITLGNGTTIVPEQLCYICESLTTATIPEGYTEIKRLAFASTNLTSITLPSTLTTIGNQAFLQAKLTSITVPVGVTAIPLDFVRNNEITSVSLPSGLLTLGNTAFAGNDGLTSITIPSSVTAIGSGCFESCPLVSVTIGAGVTITDTLGYTMGTNAGFKTYYEAGGSLAGTYEYSGGAWSKL